MRAADKTKRSKEIFLKVYRDTDSIKLAREAAGVRRSCVYNWREKDPEFADLMDEAHEDFVDSLVYAAHEHATSMRAGDSKTIQFLLKGYRSEVFGDKGSLKVDFSNVGDDELERIAAGKGSRKAGAGKT